jgi:hypothetical protein
MKELLTAAIFIKINLEGKVLCTRHDEITSKINLYLMTIVMVKVKKHEIPLLQKPVRLSVIPKKTVAI